MNKKQKEVEKTKLSAEEEELKYLKGIYQKASDEVAHKIAIHNGTINVLLANYDDLSEEEKSILQSKIYQKNFQKSLQKQLDGFLADLDSGQYKSIEEYLNTCYETGFIGTMYDLHGQGIPIVSPIDQKNVVKAIHVDSKISKPLYTKLGEDVDLLKQRIRSTISRGIATSSSFSVMARNIAADSNVGFNRAMRIARTEGHRIQTSAALDAQHEAKKKGADVVKQWDSTLDGKTRDTHRKLDGQIRELDEDFEVAGMKASAPGHFGDPAEDVNCRCAILQRARWALGEEELETLKKRAESFGLDKTDDFEEYKKKYLKAAESEKVRMGAQKMNDDVVQRLLDQGVVVDIENAGKYHDIAIENLNHLDKLMNEYDSTTVAYTVAKGSSNTEKGAAYMLNGRTSISVEPSAYRLNKATDALNLGENQPYGITYHEFAHSLSQSKEKTDPEFWKEIRKIKKEYEGNRGNANWFDVQISSYASKDVDEFLAEAFTQAKLAANPSVYSKRVLETVDKYFKKEQIQTSVLSSKAIFKEAKTIDEAEEYARLHFVKEKTWSGNGNVSFKGISIESANEINRTLTDIYDNYDLKKLSNIQPMNFRSNIWKGSETTPMAYRNLGDGELYFNPKIVKSQNTVDKYIEDGKAAFVQCSNNIDKFSGSNKELIERYVVSGRSLVAEDAENALQAMTQHEIGHHIQNSIIAYDKEAVEVVKSGYDKYAINISGYATKSNGEYIAESFAAYSNGERDKIDPALAKIFDKQLKGEKSIASLGGNANIKTTNEYVKNSITSLETIQLPKQEYAHVMSEINTHMSDEQRNQSIVSKAIGDYVYTFENYGFNEYRIIGKVPIDGGKYDEIERIFNE